MTNTITKAKYQASRLYAVDPPEGYAENMLLGTLQGLAANAGDEQIIVRTGAYDLYRHELKNEYKCHITEKDEEGRELTVFSLLRYFSYIPDGYILISDDPKSEGAYVAVSIAAQLNAVVATESIENAVKNCELPILLDARELDDNWLRQSEYFGKLNRRIAVEQPAESAPKLVDYAVSAGAYFAYVPGKDKKAHTEKFDFLEPGAVVYGWNSVLGEIDTVASFASLNVCLVPADHAYNLSTLSGFKREKLTQKQPAPKKEKPNETKHTVCFIMSDGDNMQWLLNAFGSSEKWYGSKLRGKFPIGWGMCATALDVTAPMAEHLYKEQTKNDEFIMQLSGVGYTFPSKWDKDELDKMASELSDKMNRLDLKYAEVLDDRAYTTETLSAFTSKDGIEGLFYIDYWNYAGMNGRMLWSNGKPIVSAKYRLWADLDDGQIDAIAEKINNSSVNPKNEDAYSFIIVHCWSGLDKSGALVPDGNTMDAVNALISKFNGNVEVVTPSVFMARIKNNFGNR